MGKFFCCRGETKGHILENYSFLDSFYVFLAAYRLAMVIWVGSQPKHVSKRGSKVERVMFVHNEKFCPLAIDFVVEGL